MRAAFIIIDLETLSLNIKSAPIISLGGYLMGIIETDLTQKNNHADFWNQSQFVVKDTFHEICNYTHQEMDNRIADQSTLDWWESIGGDAIKLLKQSEQSNTNITDVLHSFNIWFKDIQNQCDEIYILGNGAAFDNALLEIAYRDYQIKCPWKYTNSLCLRTLYATFDLTRMSLPFSFTEEQCKRYIVDEAKSFVIAHEGSFIAHNALNDAMFQGHKAKLMFPKSMWIDIVKNTHRKSQDKQ